uniref:Interferon regulatory factor 5 n=1 Tax=Oryzias latipes TaxID=8090 RepID=A0A3P9ISQ4_ORYLA
MSVQPRRVRLKPWLLAQVNSGRYPGLQWLGPDHRLFQIPWKHATRHTPVSDEENTIFKAWAVETGKYLEGVDEPDPAKWKANLRCALNKSREFQLKYDGTKETPLQPYKIYEVCKHPGVTGELYGLSLQSRWSAYKAVCSHGGLQSRWSAVTVVCSHGALQSRWSAFKAVCGHSGQRTAAADVPCVFPDPPIGEPPFSELPRLIPLDLPIASDLQLQVEQRGFVQHTGLPNGLHDLNSLPATQAEPGLMEASTMEAVQNQTGSQNQQTFKYDLLSSVPLTDLDLKFQYRGTTMGSETVSNPQGCRLYYGPLEPTPDQVDLFGPVSLQQVRFPGTSEIQNQKQRFYTDALLDVMDRGLILEILDQDIYAIRLCQCKVFWSGPGLPEPGPPNPIEREKRIKVFCLNDFLQGLILYQKGEAPNPPPFEVYFCFGEDWPDKKPKERKLIIVQVVPVVARILTEMFSGEMSWSTDSIRLQISNPNVKDQTVEQFKELQRLLQSQNIQGPWTAIAP